MVVLAEYQENYPNLSINRSEGVIEVRMHSNGTALQWGIDPGSVHDQLGNAFYQISRDSENHVMILTGTGESYCDRRNYDEYKDISGPHNAYRLEREGVDLLDNLLGIEIPVISAINGPVLLHPELAVFADIVLAAPHVTFTDSHIGGDMVPGDGAHIIWSAVLGPTRAAYFLLTGEQLSAEEALRMGAVHEIVSADALMDRARWHAQQLRTKSPLTLRYARVAMTQMLKQRFATELRLGLVAEMLAVSSRRA